jgi:hypothetical protein
MPAAGATGLTIPWPSPNSGVTHGIHAVDTRAAIRSHLVSARATGANVDDAGPGATVNNFLIHGTVTLTGGGQARLQATAHDVRRPDGTLVVETGVVRLTPL